MVNIIIGIAMIVAGASGYFELALFGGGPMPLILVGVALTCWGVFSVVNPSSEEE